MNEIYQQALKLLERRDYTVAQLRRKLIEQFGDAPENIIDELIAKRFLDDRRFVDNVVSRRGQRHPSSIRTTLMEAGVSEDVIDQAIAEQEWPSLRNVLEARMIVRKLRPPLRRRDAARLFRDLGRLGYPEDDIKEELEQLHGQ